MRKYFNGEALRRVEDFQRLNLRRCARRAIALLITTAMLSLGTTVAFASPKHNSEVPTGMTTIRGVVMIDGSAAISGQTLFSGSSIVTAQRSESTVYLGNLTRLKLDDESALTLEFSRSSVSISLQKGSLHGFLPVGVQADIITGDVSLTTDPGQPVAFNVQTEPGGTTISVETGRVEVRTGNSLRSVTAGERFSTSDSEPLLPGPQQNHDRKRIWLLLGIAGAVAVLLVAIIGRDGEVETPGCAIAPSGTTGGPQICP